MTFDLSESQKRFWRGHKLHSDLPIYNMAWRIDLHFAVRPEVFRAALLATIRDNPVLRTVYRDSGGEPVQSIGEAIDDALSVLDYSSKENPKERLVAQMADWVQKPFDLEQCSMRNQLVKLAEDHWVWGVCQHHIICDAQSGAVLFDLVSQHYSALSQNLTGEIPPSPDYFESAAFTKLEPSVTQTASRTASSPPYGSSPTRESFSTRLSLPIDQDTLTDIEHSIGKPEFRLFTPELSRLALHLTAYFAFLHRVTGDELITIGLPSHNRLSDTDRKTLGLFVETLPFPVEIDPKDSLEALHGKVKTGLGSFLREARPGAVATKNTSDISAVLNFIRAKFESFAGQPASVQWLHSGAHDAAHAMRLHVTDFAGNGEPNLFLDVHNEILDVVTGDNVAVHLACFLKTLVRAPNEKINAIDIASNPEDRSIVFGAAEDQDIPPTVLDAFSRHVAISADRTAISTADTSISYVEVDERSNQIASQIHRLGISTGSRIAVHMPRSIDFVLAVLGILKSGCSFVPIAANVPFARAEQIISGCDASAIFVTSEDHRAFSCKSLSVSESIGEATFIQSKAEASQTAYVLFTSGSTGTPKGVAVDHRNLSRYAHWAASAFGDGGPAHYPFFSSISFDLTLTSLFVPMITGGSIRIYPETSDPDLAVLDVFADDRVTTVKLTPSHLSLVCKAGQPVQTIETLVLGGENLTSQLCRKAQDVLSPAIRICNEYGPTEAVIGAMLHEFDRKTDTDASVQIGQPAAGIAISVRNDALNICPFGIVGEIVLSGRLAQGYISSHAISDEKFVQDPFGKQGWIYRTGDLGRIYQDGRLEYLGRADQQIKRGGVRLEVAEIEHAIRQHPDVGAVYIGFESRNSVIKAAKLCRKCGLEENVPGSSFAEDDLCGVCAEFEDYKNRANAYFRSEPELAQLISAASEKAKGNYDAVMLLSGGKDSTYAAFRLADYTSRVLAVTLDNGFIADQAKANIQRVTADLGWDHRYLSTDKMNQIFVDSLKHYSNVCQGCFKALYTLAFRTALSEGAPLVVTGLSRGQFFETRLTPDLFKNARPTCAQLEQMVNTARKIYHAEDDELSRLLETDDLKDGQFLKQTEVLDIYRYIDVPVSDVYSFLETQTAWVRPSDTGRSTNCLINDVGIHLHKSREGYHNYALPYSWDVRMGHKTREQAIAELEDDIDQQQVTEILDQIGFDEPIEREPRLVAYVASDSATEQGIWNLLQTKLQREMMPDQIVVLKDIPLTANGKVDHGKLPTAISKRGFAQKFLTPETPMEVSLSKIMCDALKTSKIGTNNDFFDLGVDSLAAIEIAMKANEKGIALPATALFEYRTLKTLAAFADGLATEVLQDEEEPALIDLDDDELANITRALG